MGSIQYQKPSEEHQKPVVTTQESQIGKRGKATSPRKGIVEAATTPTANKRGIHIHL
jgi:hypothetical protein